MKKWQTLYEKISVPRKLQNAIIGYFAERRQPTFIALAI